MAAESAKSNTFPASSYLTINQALISAGNSTSSAYRPYGLNCSSFADWVFYKAADGVYYPGNGGGATM